MNVSVKTEAVSRANNHGTQVSESIVDAGVRAAPSAEGLSVVEQPKLDEMPAEACSDVTDKHKKYRKHSHYFKPVSGLEYIDIYRVLDLFDVHDPCLQHAAKKILLAGSRGSKDIFKDVQEAIDTLLRWQEMRREDEKESGHA